MDEDLEAAVDFGSLPDAVWANILQSHWILLTPLWQCCRSTRDLVLTLACKRVTLRARENPSASTLRHLEAAGCRATDVSLTLVDQGGLRDVLAAAAASASKWSAVKEMKVRRLNWRQRATFLQETLAMPWHVGVEDAPMQNLHPPILSLHACSLNPAPTHLGADHQGAHSLGASARSRLPSPVLPAPA
jgi:hypothetical protein